MEAERVTDLSGEATQPQSGVEVGDGGAERLSLQGVLAAGRGAERLRVPLRGWEEMTSMMGLAYGVAIGSFICAVAIHWSYAQNGNFGYPVLLALLAIFLVLASKL